MEAVLETGIPDLDKEMGKSIDGKTITPATLVAIWCPITPGSTTTTPG